jgi:class III poly(R)-hydroxyalkanoic acid synthase PhaE subunit
MNDNPFNAWASQLLEYQRQYQNAWLALDSKPDSGAFPFETFNDINPWAAALGQWWQVASTRVTPPVQDFYTRLVEQGKVYFQTADGLNKAFREAAEEGDSAPRWQDAMNNTLAGLREVFSGHRPDVQGATHRAIAFWELPLNMWRRAMSSTSILPGDFLQNVNALGVGQVRDELHGHMDQLLSTPAIGYMREDQEKTQTLMNLAIDYQQALQEYVATFEEIAVECVEALRQRLEARIAEDKPVASLREMYDLWVDGSEQAYVEYVRSDHYVEVHGRLVNSLMKLKRHGTMLVDEALGAMNMPTRAEVDTLHRRLQEVRREIKGVQAAIESLKSPQKTMPSKNKRGLRHRADTSARQRGERRRRRTEPRNPLETGKSPAKRMPRARSVRPSVPTKTPVRHKFVTIRSSE